MDQINNHYSNLFFNRSKNNPIITPNIWPYPVNSVFNPGAIEYKGETLLLVRVEDLRGFSHFTIAKSNDGENNWRISPSPALLPLEESMEEQWGIEDPRIVWLKDHKEYAITYVSFSRGGPLVSLATTKDFVNFKRFGALVPPEDKDASLFPRLIGNRYVLIHRPIIRGEAHIWISFSPDLIHWGEHQILISPRSGWWDNSRVGLGPPPIETEDGWLIIYHGVRDTASGKLYRVGMALLDLDDPTKVLNRTDGWVFAPKESYELIGDVPGVVFPTGVILNKEKDELRMYYGASDTVTCLATAKLSYILNYLKSCSSTGISKCKYYSVF